jgi:hypothetical protein
MRVLVLSDSHGRDLMNAFDHYVPDWEVAELCLGRPTQELRKCYLDNICEIFDYAPEVVYLHTGHNDVSYHPIHNRIPQQPLSCFEKVLGFMDLLEEKHPYSDVFYSTLFPRALGPGFDAQRKSDYNRVASDFQDVVKRVAEMEGRRCCMNAGLWKDVSAGLEMPELFNSGGLHLNEAGQRTVVRGWIQSAMSAEESRE